jgi:glycine/D-amino acid oxidase-like deaminating enzyme/Rieske Fe-S protein
MEKAQSYWKSITQPNTRFHALNNNIETEVLIIGAGITGITLAWELINAGKKVAIIEANHVSNSTTGNATGNLYVPVQSYYFNIANKHGEESAIQTAQARQKAIDYVERIVNENNIDCAFERRPWYCFTNNEKKIKSIEKEVDILKKSGLSIDFTEDLPLPERYIKAARLENQARFNPYIYTLRLAQLLVEKGCQIYENTIALDIQNPASPEVITSKAVIKAKKVIMATHIPKGFHPTQTLVFPYTSYVVAATLKGEYPNGNFWNMDHIPAHAISTHGKTSQGLDIIMFAGNHHKTGQGKQPYTKNFAQLKDYIYKKYDVKDIVCQWSAQHFQSADHLPYIGPTEPLSKNIYLATGYAADGLTYGVLAGIILTDQILENENPYTRLFSSTRFKPLASAKKFATENINVATQYAKDLILDLSSKHIKNIKAGQGKVVQLDTHKLAVYADQDKKITVMSAICPHMGCAVHWNDAEKTWDCPCHGSRFSCKGNFIEGPAYHDLEKKEVSIIEKKQSKIIPLLTKKSLKYAAGISFLILAGMALFKLK